MANEGINRFARVLDGRMHRHEDKPPILDFGEIQENMSLRTNNFPEAIPQSDYIVCRSAVLNPDALWATTTTADGHSHDVNFPGALRPLQAGDRVLVAWVGDDAVVIDLITPA